MGRHLQRQLESHHPGCLWGILHILDYHQWSNVKKMAPHKKRRRGRRAVCWRNPETISLERGTGEVQSLLDADADNFLDTAKLDATDKHSGKACIKTLITEEMSKEANNKQLVLGFPAQSRLQRTYSIHHLDPSDFRLGKMSTDWTNPIIVLHKDADTSARFQVSSLKRTTRKLVARKKNLDCGDSGKDEDKLGQYQFSGEHDKVMENSKNLRHVDAKQLNREILHHQVKEYVDVLELFKINKEKFLKILKDQDVGVSEHFPGQEISNKKVKLTKSGSFPIADPSRVRFPKPSKLERKQNETWTFPKGEMVVSSTEVPKSDSALSQKGYNLKTVPSSEDNNIGIAIKQRPGLSSRGSPQVSSHGSWNQFVMGHYKDIKQKIKYALKESKKETEHSNIDGADGMVRVPSRCTLLTDGTEMPRGFGNISIGQDAMDSSRSCHESDGSDHDLRNSRLSHMRTTSLNESLDRYAQLFESSFSREPKLPHSKSLKLRSEDEVSSRERAPKFFRRISSLSELESFWSLLNEVAHDSEIPVTTEADSNKNIESNQTKSSNLPVATGKLEPLDAVVENQFRKNTEQGSDSNAGTEYSGALAVDNIDEKISLPEECGESVIDPLRVASISPQDHDSGSTVNPSLGLVQPSSIPVLETCFPDKIMDSGACPISEGSELNPVGIDNDGPDSSFDIQNRTAAESLPGLCSILNHDKDDQFRDFELGDNDASFSYVRDVLQLSGFIGNECLGTWYSLDQPLDPSLFKELEADLHHELQWSGEEVGGNCDHQLLFDLINEVLLEFYERSFTYFPRAFSFNQHIRPMLKGNRVLDEVWARICRYQSFRSDLDQSLDDIVARDLTKGDGWMNHQFETECITLEIEDLIIDELLDEFIYS